MLSFLKVGATKMVLVVRMDINMGGGKAAAQCAHAAVQCYITAASKFKSKLLAKTWLLSGQPKIVVKVQTEKEMMRIAKEATQAGIVVAAIKDAGKTQLKPGTVTVLGVGPGPKEDIDKLTSHLRLL